jgi:uncharacterized protein YceK
MFRLSTFIFLLIVLGTVGCGSTHTTTPTPPAPGSDTTSPTVVSISPPNGAKGVKDDENIIITFSEKMDKAATQAAYQSADLPASEVTFT